MWISPKTKKSRRVNSISFRQGNLISANVVTTLNCVVCAVFDNMLEINREMSASITEHGYLSTERRFDSEFRYLVRWGVSKGLLPETLDRKAVEVNTEPHDWPEAHWVCLYVTSLVVEYFDSYRLPPICRNILFATGRIHNPHVYQNIYTRTWVFNYLH
jgi:hypothetical protein